MLSKDYLEWLYFMFGDKTAYSISLFETLSNIEYRFQNGLDENRACGGLQLRSKYAWETGIYENEVASGPCSVLEMMCALAKHMYMNTSLCNPAHFMLDMINNLGLIRMSENEVIRTINNWMDGNYGDDGSGSIFLIPGHKIKGEDIWTQMNIYLNIFYPQYNVF